MSLVNFGTASRSLTQKSKKLAKIKIDFLPFLGSAVLGGAVFFYYYLNTAVGSFFFLTFLMRKIQDFLDDLVESTFLAGGNSKSYGNFEILKFDRRI